MEVAGQNVRVTVGRFSSSFERLASRPKIRNKVGGEGRGERKLWYLFGGAVRGGGCG